MPPILPPQPWERVSVLIPYRLRVHVTEFQFQNYIQSRGETVRRLIRSGLLYEQGRGDYTPHPSLPALDEDEGGA